MAAGYPVKVNYLTGDVLTAANLNDLAGTVNLYDPTAKGDLFPATAADTVSRLAVGADATVLTADSTTATGMKWAAAAVATSGLTLISTTTLAATGSFNINGVFSATYDDYIIEMDEIVGSVGSYYDIGLRIGGTNSATNYRQVNYQFTYAGVNNSNTQTSGTNMMNLSWGTAAADASGSTLKLKGVFLAKGTQFQVDRSMWDSGGIIRGQHNAATSYDSLFFTIGSGTVSGVIRIYGLAK